MTEKAYEHDLNFAQACANYLHDMYLEGVLTTNDLERFGDKEIDELVLRIHKGGFPPHTNYMRWEHGQKLKAIFHSETLPKVERPDTFEITKFVENFLDHQRQRGFDEITGAIVYGSLVDETRFVREGSDLDILLLANTHSGSLFLENAWLQDPDSEVSSGDIEIRSRYENWKQDAYKFAKYVFPQFQNTPLEIGHIYNRDMFEYALSPDSKMEVPWWLYSQGIYTIGGFEDMSEEKVDAEIEAALKSKWVKESKLKTIEDIKKNLTTFFGRNDRYKKK